MPKRLGGTALAALLKDGKWFVLVQAASKIQVLVVLGAVAGSLGVRDFGIFAVYISLALLASVAIDAGFSACLAREWVGAARLYRAGLPMLLVERALLVIAAAAGLVIALHALPNSSGASATVPVLLVAITIAINQVLFQAAYAGGGFRRLSGLYGVSRILGLAPLLLLLLPSWQTPIRAVMTQGLAEAITLGFLLPQVVSRIKGRRDPDLVRPLSVASLRLRHSLPYATTAAINISINRADAYLVGLFSSATTVGLFAPASQLQNALTTVGLTVAGGFSLRVARLRDAPDLDLQRRLLREALRGTLTATLALAIVLAPLLPLLVNLLLGGDFGNTGYAAIALVALSPLTVAAGVNLSYLTAAGHAARATQVWFAALVVVVLAHAAITSRYGLAGAVVSVFLRDLSLFLFSARLVRTVNRARSAAG